MRNLILIIGCLFTTLAFGQQLEFRGQLVDTISIEGYSALCHFDKNGTTTGKAEIYTMSFDKDSGKYGVTKHSLNSFQGTFKPTTYKETNKQIDKSIGTVIPNVKLERLLASFLKKYVKPTFENLEIKEEDFLSLTKEKHIRKIAKEYDMAWHFKKYYTTKEENKILFKGCQNIDTFNLFLSSGFDTTYYLMVTDVWGELYVKVKAKSREFVFEGKYPNKYKQPWYDHNDTTRNGIGSIVNLNINRYLVSIMPDNFIERNTIEFEALMDYYIRWYLARRKIIFSEY